MRPGPKPQPIRHGTQSGYVLHRYRGEDACQACLDAHAVYSDEARERARERKALIAAARPP